MRDPAQWSGRVFAEFGYTNLAGWRAWVDYPLDVRRGEGRAAPVGDARRRQDHAGRPRTSSCRTCGAPGQGPAGARSVLGARPRLRARNARAATISARAASRSPSPGAPPMNAHQLSRDWEPAQQRHARAARLGQRQPDRARAARAPGGVPAVSRRPAQRCSPSSRRRATCSTRSSTGPANCPTVRDSPRKHALRRAEHERLAQHPGIHRPVGQPGREPRSKGSVIPRFAQERTRPAEGLSRAAHRARCAERRSAPGSARPPRRRARRPASRCGSPT